MLLSDQEISRRNTALQNAVLMNREQVFGNFHVHIEYLLYWREPNPFRTPDHSHQFWELSWLTHGSIQYHTLSDRKIISLNGNDARCVMIPPGRKHFRVNTEKNVQILGFMLAIRGRPPEDDRRLLKQMESLEYCLSIGSKTIPDELENALSQTAVILKTEEIGLFIRLLLLHIFRCNFSPLFESFPLLHRYRNPIWMAENHIAEHLNSPISAEKLAALCKRSRRQFYQDFESEYGMPVNRFIRDRRLSAAARELICSQDPVKEIAANAGFRNMSYFIRLFRQHYSMTPGDFRKRYGDSSKQT